MFNLFHWLMDHGAASESQNRKRYSEYQQTVNYPGCYCCQGPAKVSFDPDCHISSVKAWISTSKKVISIPKTSSSSWSMGCMPVGVQSKFHHLFTQFSL